jgi:predicted membrane channel-forming protein YqfA (hemolysin III family)
MRYSTLVLALAASLTPHLFLLFRDVSRCCMVISQVTVSIVLFGVSTLASIQSPLRVQPPKGFNADEKKNQ